MVVLTAIPAQTGDCISDRMMSEMLRRLSASVQETSTPGDAVVSRTPPTDTSKIWYPADENGFPVGTAYKFDPIQGQWISTAVVPQPPPCRSNDEDSIIELDNSGCWKVSRSRIETIVQNVGLKISADSDNAIIAGSDGGLYVETVDVSAIGQLELLATPVSITTATDSVTATDIDLDTLPAVTTPTWATHAIVRAKTGLITNNLGGNNTNKAYTRVLLNGSIVAAVGPSTGPNTQTDSQGDDTNDVYTVLDGTEINYQFTLNQSASWGAADAASFSLTLIGFVRASIP